MKNRQVRKVNIFVPKSMFPVTLTPPYQPLFLQCQCESLFLPVKSIPLIAQNSSSQMNRNAASKTQTHHQKSYSFIHQHYPLRSSSHQIDYRHRTRKKKLLQGTLIGGGLGILDEQNVAYPLHVLGEDAHEDGVEAPGGGNGEELHGDLDDGLRLLDGLLGGTDGLLNDGGDVNVSADEGRPDDHIELSEGGDLVDRGGDGEGLAGDGLGDVLGGGHELVVLSSTPDPLECRVGGGEEGVLGDRRESGGHFVLIYSCGEKNCGKRKR